MDKLKVVTGVNLDYLGAFPDLPRIEKIINKPDSKIGRIRFFKSFGSFWANRLPRMYSDWMFQRGDWHDYLMPVEVAVHLCLVTGSVGCFDLPYGASEEELARICDAIEYGLNPTGTEGRYYDISIGNEPWNIVGPYATQAWHFGRLARARGYMRGNPNSGRDLSLSGYAVALRDLKTLIGKHGRLFMNMQAYSIDDTAGFMLRDCDIARTVDNMAIAPYWLTGPRTKKWIHKTRDMSPDQLKERALKDIKTHMAQACFESSELAHKWGLKAFAYEVNEHHLSSAHSMHTYHKSEQSLEVMRAAEDVLHQTGLRWWYWYKLTEVRRISGANTNTWFGLLPLIKGELKTSYPRSRILTEEV